MSGATGRQASARSGGILAALGVRIVSASARFTQPPLRAVLSSQLLAGLVPVVMSGVRFAKSFSESVRNELLEVIRTHRRVA